MTLEEVTWAIEQEREFYIIKDFKIHKYYVHSLSYHVNYNRWEVQISTLLMNLSINELYPSRKDANIGLKKLLEQKIKEIST